MEEVLKHIGLAITLCSGMISITLVFVIWSILSLKDEISEIRGKMPETTEMYSYGIRRTDEEENDDCYDCKYKNVSGDKEPCKSCYYNGGYDGRFEVVDNWEREE